ncbi:MAG: trigger factor [Holosporales bacterium]|jgi:trigger factor|nr:trigger factor [Holosporales bacterium]
MRIIKESVEDFQHHYEVLLPSAEIMEKVEERLVRISPNARIPGFRLGKAPLAAVQRLYEPSVYSEEVEKLISETVKSIVANSKARLRQDPRVEILADTEEGLTVSVDFTVLPTVEAPKDFSNLCLEKLVVEVEDKEVDERLEYLRKTHRGWKEAPVTHSSQKGDLIVADIFTKSSKKALNNDKAKGLSFVIGGGKFVADFESHFLGVSAGKRLSFSVTYPKNTTDKQFSNATVHYTAFVKQVCIATTFDSDEDFAKDVGFDSVAACRANIKTHLKSEYEKLSANHLKRQVLDVLSDRYVFEIPQDIEEAEFTEIWQSFEYDNKEKLGNISKKELDTIRTNYRNIANRRVRLGLLIAEVARQSKVSVAQKELDECIANVATHEDPQNAEKLYAYYRRNQQAVAVARASVLEDKAIAHIVTQAQVSERKVSLEEIMREKREASSTNGEEKSLSQKKAKDRGKGR